MAAIAKGKSIDSGLIYGFQKMPAGDALIGYYGTKICFLAFVCDDSGKALKEFLKTFSGAVLTPDLPAFDLEDVSRGSRKLDDFYFAKSTPFQRRVWQELLTIPHGTTVSYSDIACRIGKPKAVRAVARAIGSNPISVLIPCHRVVGASGALTGYRWGLEAKQKLLALECALQ